MLRDSLYRPWFGPENVWGIEILDGDFSKVVLAVEKLEFKDENDDGSGNLVLEYNIISAPSEYPDGSLEKNELFHSTLDIVINDVLKEAIESHEQSIRESNTKQPDSQ